MPDNPPKNIGKNIGPNGAVLNVGNPGNKGGTGRPPEELRRAMQVSMWRALELANELMEGEVQLDDVRKVLDTFGKYSLGPAAPENPVPAGDQVVLTMDARTKQDDDETND